ncbi:hypothetical protein [Polaribacter porphyrae]|nr:hypothetical protein [Polaribacter porphyrae]
MFVTFCKVYITILNFIGEKEFKNTKNYTDKYLKLETSFPHRIGKLLLANSRKKIVPKLVKPNRK